MPEQQFTFAGRLSILAPHPRTRFSHSMPPHIGMWAGRRDTTALALLAALLLFAAPPATPLLLSPASLLRRAALALTPADGPASYPPGVADLAAHISGEELERQVCV